MDLLVFVIAAAIILGGAAGVIGFSNPVHNALSLVATLFGVAVLFVAQEAHFLAAVQIIVYAGAVVVLFLFVIMLLGVDEAEDLSTDPLGGQRPAAAAAGITLLGLAIAVVLLARADEGLVTGAPSLVGSLVEGEDSNIVRIARALFTDYLFAFETTSILLVVAIVAAVLLARRPPASDARTDAEVGSDSEVGSRA
jgi:NADH-quinone oxidoreductase subunit J